MKDSIQNQPAPLVDEVQLLYASLLVWFVRIALIALFGSFILYATGVVGSAIDITDVPDRWHLSAGEYVVATQTATGWSWLDSLDQGRTLSLAALVLFPAGTMVLTAVAFVLYLRNRLPAYALITFVQVVVFAVAASGVLAAK